MKTLFSGKFLSQRQYFKEEDNRTFCYFVDIVKLNKEGYMLVFGFLISIFALVCVSDRYIETKKELKHCQEALDESRGIRD